jgi:hypothetical protein
MPALGQNATGWVRASSGHCPLYAVSDQMVRRRTERGVWNHDARTGAASGPSSFEMPASVKVSAGSSG